VTRLLAAAAAVLAALPLVPRLSPNWPGGWMPFVALLAAAALLVFVIVRVLLRRPLDTGTLLLSGAFPLYALYTGNLAHHSSGDNLATLFVGPQLVTHGTLDLAPLFPPENGGLPYSMVLADTRVLPRLPLGTPFLVLPHTALAVAGARGERLTLTLARRWEKHAAALVAVAAVALLFAGVRRAFGDAAALGTAAVFALATTLPTAGSQALWTFTGEVFFISLALFFLLPEIPSEERALAAGVALGAAFLCRPTALAAGVALGLLALRRGRKDTAAFARGAAASLALVCLFQIALYDHPLGAYGTFNTGEEVWAGNGLEGLAGNLVSPSRGALIFFPYLLLVPVAAGAVRRQASLRAPWIGALFAFGATFLLASLYGKWWGGHSLGPRLLSEAAPFLALLTLPLWLERSRRGGFAGTLLIAAVSLAAVNQLVFSYNPRAGAWNGEVNVDSHRSFLWSWRNSQLAAAWRPNWTISPSFARLLPERNLFEDELLPGSIESPAEGATVTGALVVTGWARAAGQDLAVEIILDDRPEIRPRVFDRRPRPDVASVLPELGDCAAAGYEATFDGRGGDAGRHEISVVFLTNDGRFRRYPARHFQWKP
jgi:hypothetical protein